MFSVETESHLPELVVTAVNTHPDHECQYLVVYQLMQT